MAKCKICGGEIRAFKGTSKKGFQEDLERKSHKKCRDLFNNIYLKNGVSFQEDLVSVVNSLASLDLEVNCTEGRLRFIHRKRRAYANLLEEFPNSIESNIQRRLI